MPKRAEKSSKEKEVNWRNVIAKQKASGLSQSAFCEKEGLKAKLFSLWKCKLDRQSRKEKDKSTSITLPVSTRKSQNIFVPIAHPTDTKLIASSERPIAELDLSGGVVRIYEGIDRHSLYEIVSALREVAF